jgi:hypothetical protein
MVPTTCQHNTEPRYNLNESMWIAALPEVSSYSRPRTKACPWAVVAQFRASYMSMCGSLQCGMHKHQARNDSGTPDSSPEHGTMTHTWAVAISAHVLRQPAGHLSIETYCNGCQGRELPSSRIQQAEHEHNGWTRHKQAYPLDTIWSLKQGAVGLVQHCAKNITTC